MKERRLVAEQQAMREQHTDNSQQQQQHQQPDRSALLGASPSSFASKKPTAAERIGYRRPR